MGWVRFLLTLVRWVVSLDMMRTVSVIKDDKIVSDHTDYPVTNMQWKRMEYELVAYLDGLDLTELFYSTICQDVWCWYLRERSIKVITKPFDTDPWDRRFVCFPIQKPVLGSVYNYHSFYNSAMIFVVNVIVTTVNGMKVYCVDVIRSS
jgi:hypothetical protein